MSDKKWLSAHVIYHLEEEQTKQPGYLIEEDIYLIHVADDEEDEWDIAEALGKSKESHCDIADGKQNIRRRFIGVRKIIEPGFPFDYNYISFPEHLHGIRVTHSTFRVNNIEDLEALIYYTEDVDQVDDFYKCMVDIVYEEQKHEF